MSTTFESKLEVEQLAKRISIKANLDHSVPTLIERLEQSSYQGANLKQRLYELEDFLLNTGPVKISNLKKKIRWLDITTKVLIMGVVIFVAYFANSFVALFPKSNIIDGLTFFDAVFNILTGSLVLLFGIRQFLREQSQNLVKEMVDNLQRSVHLLDMHQMGKGAAIDESTRAIIAETIIICGKIAAVINQESDDPYVISSVKHLEIYSEMVAQRIFNAL